MRGVQIELIARTHHVDSDDPDASGMVAWRYEYDLITLRASGGLEAIVRAYADAPRDANLLRFTLNGDPIGQADAKKSHSEAVAAVASFLRDEGFKSVQWLESEGYVEVPF